MNADQLLHDLQTEAATLELLAALTKAETELRAKLAEQYDVRSHELWVTDLKAGLDYVTEISPDHEWIEVLSAETSRDGVHARLLSYTRKQP